MKAELCEVHLRKDESYVTVFRGEAEGVTAEFRVTVGKRGQRTGQTHAKKPFEMLDAETREKVADFCVELGAMLGKRRVSPYTPPPPQRS